MKSKNLEKFFQIFSHHRRHLAAWIRHLSHLSACQWTLRFSPSLFCSMQKPYLCALNWSYLPVSYVGAIISCLTLEPSFRTVERSFCVQHWSDLYVSYITATSFALYVRAVLRWSFYHVEETKNVFISDLVNSLYNLCFMPPAEIRHLVTAFGVLRRQKKRFLSGLVNMGTLQSIWHGPLNDATPYISLQCTAGNKWFLSRMQTDLVVSWDRHDILSRCFTTLRVPDTSRSVPLGFQNAFFHALPAQAHQRTCAHTNIMWRKAKIGSMSKSQRESPVYLTFWQHKLTEILSSRNSSTEYLMPASRSQFVYRKSWFFYVTKIPAEHMHGCLSPCKLRRNLKPDASIGTSHLSKGNM